MNSHQPLSVFIGGKVNPAAIDHRFTPRLRGMLARYVTESQARGALQQQRKQLLAVVADMATALGKLVFLGDEHPGVLALRASVATLHIELDAVEAVLATGGTELAPPIGTARKRGG